MKSFIVTLSLVIGVAVVAPAYASDDAKCKVCGAGGGSEMVASFDPGFGEVCVPMTGNGYGYDDCKVHYIGTTTFCEGDGDPTCRGGVSLAPVTGIDGYLVAGGRSASQQPGAVQELAVRRPCDGAIVARQFSSEHASSNAGSTTTISL